jgi:DNA topoisomerase IB
VFNTSATSVRKVLADQVSGYKVKDFRTWHGTAKAAAFLSTQPRPTNQKEWNALRNATGKHVSSFLNNTPAQALDAYINPSVFPHLDAYSLEIKHRGH